MDQIKQRIQLTNGSFIIRTYQVLSYLGKGGSAQCFEVKRQEDQKKFAIKIIPKLLILKNDKKSKILRELQLHRSLKHKNICQFYQYFEDETNIYMLIQLCSYGSFYDLFQIRGKFTVPQVQFYISQLLEALSYLHKHQIIHRDIKPGNLLLSKNRNLKLSDFGMSTKLVFDGDKKHSICGTPNFIAPEIIQHALKTPQSISGHSYQVDLWSVGVMLFAFLTGENPFEGKNKQETYQKVSKAQYQFPPQFQNEEAKDLISKLLVTNPTKRYTIKQIRKHPFFNPKKGIPTSIPQNGVYEVPNFNSGISQFSKIFKMKFGFKQNSAKNLRILNDTLENKKQKQNLIQQKSSTKTIKRSTLFEIKSDPGDQKIQTSRNIGTLAIFNRLKQLKKQDEIVTKQVLKLKRSHGPFKNVGSQAEMTNLDQCKIQDDLISIKSFRSAQYNNKKVSSINNICHEFQQMEGQPEHNKLMYVMDIKRGDIWSYILNNGYIGTYETNEKGYCVFYNSLDKIFFEVQKDELPMKTTQKYIQANTQIMKRVPYLKQLTEEYDQIKCIPYDFEVTHKNLFIYVTQAYVIKNQSLIFLKLSNNSFELFNYATNAIFLIIQKTIYLINVQKGIEKSVIQSNTFQANQHSNKVLKEMYKVFKKIKQKFQQNNLN